MPRRAEEPNHGHRRLLCARHERPRRCSKLQARLAELGGEAMPMTAAEFGKLVAAETEKWAKVVKFAGAKAD
jgi:hypothetical protein